MNLCRMHKEFRYHDVKEDVSEDHDFYKFVKGAIGRGLTTQQYYLILKQNGDLKTYKDLRMINQMIEWATEYKKNEQVRAYEDMIQEFNNPNTRILQAESFSVTLKICRISETKRSTGYDKTTRFFRQIGKIDPIKYKFSESYNQLDNSKLGSTQQQKIC